MHKSIKDFHTRGLVKDDNLVESKDSLIRLQEIEMRDKGYVPVWDLDPQFTLDYDDDAKAFKFHLTCYGTYVGKAVSWKVDGMTNGKMIWKPTRLGRWKHV